MPEVKPARTPSRGRLRTWLFGAILTLFVLGTAMAWVFASPVGGSPDEDYHMGSIWCPRPADGSCQVRDINGIEKVSVPVPVARGVSCTRFEPGVSAGCTIPAANDVETYSARYDDGRYPHLYYRTQHALVGHFVPTSVVLMRTLNAVIATGVLGAIGALLRREHRTAYALAMLGSWVPMGIYFITSINPTSWSIVGVFAYAAALFGSLTTEGRRRWVLLALAGVGAVLAAGSRADAAFYLAVVSVAMAAAVPKERKDVPQWAMAGVASLIGVVSALLRLSHGVQSEAMGEASNRVVLLGKTIVDLPRFFAGLVGVEFGPGWFDVPVEAGLQYLAMVLSFVVVLAGLRRGNRRTWLSAGIVALAMAAIPTIMVVSGNFATLGDYQPRYILPLFAVLIFLLLALQKGVPLSRAQLIVYGGGIVFVQTFYLHSVLWRYVMGASGHRPLNLDWNVQWWWDMPLTPTMMWAIGTVCFTGVVALTLWWVGRAADREAITR